MKLKITFSNIPRWKKDYIMKDFMHFFAELKFQMLLMLEKIDKNKGVQAKLINKLKKTKTWGTQILNTQILIETLASADMGNVNFLEDTKMKNFIVNFEMNEFYFEMIDALKKSGQGFYGYGLVDKKQIVKDFSKAFRKNITHKFNIQILE